MDRRTTIALGMLGAVAVACPANVALAQAAQPPLGPEPAFSFDTAPGRLPKSVVPERYEVTVIPDIKAMGIEGHETVVLNVRKSTDRIVLNSLNETLTGVRLDGAPAAAVKSDDEQQLTTISLAHAAAPGTHRLIFDYRGKIESRPQGLFLQPYSYPGVAPGQMLVTQMEATDARRMFPCWDEPAFRAVFDLTFKVPSAWATVSNMPILERRVEGALQTVRFQPTPKMPTYLVAFVAGDLARLSGRSGSTELGVWAVRGQQGNGRYALANATQILADYNDYFGYSFPLPKLDSLAIPGGFSGAMENWGAITYNDQLLLWPPSGTLGQQQQVYATQAHEMAHQWNGDLVTLGWWDDLWLNESFASWMAAKETDRRNPSWHWWEQEDGDKESAMRADALPNSPAIQQHVTDELQASNAFDPTITYNKGQSILRMFEAYLGDAAFRDGIRRYIRAHAFSNATSTDLWNGLAAATGKDVGKIAGDWTRRPGFPLVRVTASCGTGGARILHFAQTRFLVEGKPEGPSHWNVPLQVRVGAAGKRESVLLEGDAPTLPAGRCAEPLSVDADAIGFYRVQYDPATLRTNTAHFGELPDGDRIALLDDQWALVLASAEPLGNYLALASGMGQDLDARAWQQISAALDAIEYDTRGDAAHDAFTAYARSVLAPVFARLGWASKPGDTADQEELRRTLIRSLGLWGDAEVIRGAQQRFEKFLSDRASLPPSDQSPILTVVAYHADAKTFEQLHQLARSAKSVPELERYYSALASVRDPHLAEQAAQAAFSSELPPQVGDMRLQIVARLAHEHPALAWRLFTAHAHELLVAQGTFEPLIEAQFVPLIFWNAAPLAQIEAWVRSKVPAEMAPVLARGMASARLERAEKQLLAQQAARFAHHS
ncbi:MAG TPA: M1 family aminopeptidase [Steroidobacteraceae bacterium]|nr:M1 family aminopeptidase [Steroidobacteraceae bacterium]